MTIFGYRIPMAASLLLWAVVWEIVGRAELSFLLPPLSNVVMRLVEIAPTPSFVEAIGLTAEAFFLGLAIAIAAGIPLGVVMGRSTVADRLLAPWVNMFVSAPLTALVPVIMVLFGLGMTTIVLTVVLFAIWIIVLDARAGVRNIAPSLIEMAQCYGANEWQAFCKIYVWAALPEILAGIRLGVIRAIKGVVVGQLLVSIVGLGRLFEIYQSNYLLEHLWALLIVLFALAVILAELLAALERRVDYYASRRH